MWPLRFGGCLSRAFSFPGSTKSIIFSFALKIYGVLLYGTSSYEGLRIESRGLDSNLVLVGGVALVTSCLSYI